MTISNLYKIFTLCLITILSSPISSMHRVCLPIKKTLIDYKLGPKIINRDISNKKAYKVFKLPNRTLFSVKDLIEINGFFCCLYNPFILEGAEQPAVSKLNFISLTFEKILKDQVNLAIKHSIENKMPFQNKFRLSAKTLGAIRQKILKDYVRWYAWQFNKRIKQKEKDE